MPGGRPTKYTPELLKIAWDYVENYEAYGDVMPSQIGLKLACGIDKSTLLDWSKQKAKKEFSTILDIIMDKQHQCLINKGLMGEFNSNICKLALGKHGYSDKVDNNVSGSKEAPVFKVVFPDG